LKHALGIEAEWFKKNLLLKAFGVGSPEELTAIEAKIVIWEMEDVAIRNDTLLNPPLSEERKKQATSLGIILNALTSVKNRKLNQGGIP